MVTEQVRSFIAIELPDELKAGLAQLEDQLKMGRQTLVKWVDPYDIHLTLKFLGSITADRVAEITAVMAETARRVSTFNLVAKDLGVFPNWRRVQVVWVGVGGEVDKLIQLQGHLESNLARLGFAPETRPFVPHLTLARLRSRASLDERQSFGQLINAARFEADYTIKVDAINLMKSQLTRAGAIYSRVSSVGLRIS